MMLQFQYTFDDFKEAHTGTAKPRRTWLRMGWIIGALAIVAGIMIAQVRSDTTTGHDSSSLSPSLSFRMSAALGVALVIFGVTAFSNIYQALRGPMKPWERPVFAGKRSSVGLGWWLFLSAVGACLLTLLVFQGLQRPGTTPPMMRVSPAHPPLPLVEFLPGVLPWLLIYLLGHILIQIARGPGLQKVWDASPTLQTPQCVDVAEDGLVWRGAFSEARLQWPFFVGFKETANLFLLYPSPALFHMLPKRAFESPQALDRFRGLLLTHVKNGHFLEQPSAFPVVPLAGPTTPD